MSADSASHLPSIELREVLSAADLAVARALFEDYQASLDIDLCFQGFQTELDTLPGAYAGPLGTLVVAWVDGEAAGCCALRPLPTADHPNAAEMKRLFVRRAFRGFGLGRQLAESVMTHARLAGFHCVLLDTLNDMEAARALYEDMGFVEVAPYYHNPIPGAHYLKADLA